MDLFINILEAGFFNIIIVGTLLSMIYGLWLVVAPQSALKLNQKINHRFSMREATKPLEKPISIERTFYRHAKIYGALFMLGAVYLFYLLYWELNFEQLSHHMPGLGVLTWQWLLQAFMIFFSIVAISVFVVGFVLLLRPSSLKPLEAKANTWISTRQKLQFMSKERGQVDRLLDLYPRQFGAVILLAAAIILLNMDKFNI